MDDETRRTADASLTHSCPRGRHVYASPRGLSMKLNRYVGIIWKRDDEVYLGWGAQIGTKLSILLIVGSSNGVRLRACGATSGQPSPAFLSGGWITGSDVLRMRDQSQT